MNILITGGSGFIGQSFIRRFPQYQYTILTRNKVKAQLINPSCTCIDSLSDLNDLNTIDAVINLAGEPIVDKRWSQNQKHIIQHSRWDITEQLVNLINASQTPPSVFISGSAIGYYGNSNVNSDGTALHPTFPVIYAKSGKPLPSKRKNQPVCYTCAQRWFLAPNMARLTRCCCRLN